jgi:hypothetical protein
MARVAAVIGLALSLSLSAASVTAALAAGSLSPESRTPSDLSAKVSSLPLVQHVGQTYFVTITVRTRAHAVRPFCIDFDDDRNSWLFQFPAPHEYKKDVYCWKGFRAYYSKRFLVGLVPARTGQHKLGIGIGSAEFFPTINTAVLNENSLYWSRGFVVVG